MSTQFNIEIGHAAWGGPTEDADVAASVETMNAYIRHKSLTRPSFVVSLLLDDKHYKLVRGDDLANRKALLDRALGHSDLAAVVDFVVYESSLSSLIDDLSRALVDSGRSAAADDVIATYERTYDQACSIDIALWHLLRLGRLGRHDKKIVVTERAQSRQLSPPNFYAETALSFIPDSQGRYEKVARKRYLKYIDFGEIIDRIKVIKCADSDDDYAEAD